MGRGPPYDMKDGATHPDPRPVRNEAWENWEEKSDERNERRPSPR